MSKWPSSVQDYQLYFEKGYLCNCAHTISDHVVYEPDWGLVQCKECNCPKWQQMADNLRFLSLIGKVQEKKMKETRSFYRKIIWLTVVGFGLIALPCWYGTYKSDTIDSIQNNMNKYYQGLSDQAYAKVYVAMMHGDPNYEQLKIKFFKAVGTYLTYLALEIDRIAGKKDKNEALND